MKGWSNPAGAIYGWGEGGHRAANPPAKNYNFLTPYSHEITHGLALSLAALLAFAAIPSGRRRALALSGFCLGLVFLTKVEIFLALAAALGLGVLLARGASPRPFGSALRDLASLAGFAMIPVAVAFLALLWALPLDLATGALLDPWRSVLRSDVTSLEFYRWVRGTDQLGLNLERMGLWLFRYAAFAVPAAALALLIPANPRLRMGVAVAAFGLFVVFFGPGPHFKPFWQATHRRATCVSTNGPMPPGGYRWPCW